MNGGRFRPVIRPRRLGSTILVICFLLAGATPASADPAGPTDFENTILDVTPPTDSAAFSIVGGDAFLRVEALPGTEVVVIGYFGEPYLRILPDGTVEENADSPSVKLNLDRYGETVGFVRSDADLPPDWIEVGTDGTWSWHDHRMHWMSTDPPPGRVAGEVIYEDVTIPVVINGTDTLIHVSLTWLERPIPTWAFFGAILGVLLVAGNRRLRLPALGLLGVAALTVGAWQYWWLPPETEPSLLQWAVPIVALLGVGVGLRRPGIAAVAGMVAAAELAGWGLWRRDSMWRAILPTGTPYPLDRAVTAACLAGGITGVILWTVESWRRTSKTRGEIGTQPTSTSHDR